MTQEEKELVLRDLSARLLYNVKVHVKYTDNGETIELDGIVNMIDNDGYVGIEGINDFSPARICVHIDNVTPYLLPISSMTETQKRNLTRLFNCHVEIIQYEIKFADYKDSNMDNWNKVFNWCYKNHFDINSLIPMNLAIDATNLNIY